MAWIRDPRAGTERDRASGELSSDKFTLNIDIYKFIGHLNQFVRSSDHKIHNQKSNNDNKKTDLETFEILPVRVDVAPDSGE